jgi:hypothetical protein
VDYEYDQRLVKTARQYDPLLNIMCPPVLSLILDRVPKIDINWTFGTCSSLYAKEGA